MKHTLLVVLSILFFGILLGSCSRTIENKIAGTWKVEDVKFESGQPLDPTLIESSKESAKSVSYELLEDYTAKVHAGSTVLNGNWIYRQAEAGVYMAFTGSFDTVLLGRLEGEKLINEANRPDLKIITIFVKED